jgi:hypothetical protein
LDEDAVGLDCDARRPSPDKKSKLVVEVDGIMMTAIQARKVEMLRREVASWLRIGRNDPEQYELVRFRVSRDTRFSFNEDVDVEAVIRRAGDMPGWVYVYDIRIRPRGKMTAYGGGRSTSNDLRGAYQHAREDILGE